MKGKAILLLVVFGLVMPLLADADKRDITVVNKTGKPILSLFISPTDTDKWEEDVLGEDVLEDGESVEVHFSGYAKDQCEFDILATNEKGDEWLLPEVNLCEVSTITITPKYIRAK